MSTQRLALHRLFALPETKQAWAAGDEGVVLKTTDGGDSWLLEPTGVTNRLNSICFHDENRGVAVGDQGTLLQTTNGGMTWLAVPTNEIVRDVPVSKELPNSPKSMAKQAKRSGMNLDDSGPVEQSNQSVVNAAERPGRVLRPIPNLNDIQLDSDGAWLAVGDNGTVLRRSPAGSNWQLPPEALRVLRYSGPGQSPPSLTSAAFQDGFGLMTTRLPNVGFRQHSPNSGWDWAQLLTNGFVAGVERRVVPGPGSFWFTGASPGGFASHALNLVLNPDFRPRPGNSPQTGFDLCFLAPPGSATNRTSNSEPIRFSYGWAIGSQGLVLATTNAGNTWSKLADLEPFLGDYAVPTTATNRPPIFETIAFASPRIGYIAGGSFLFHTQDGGLSWKAPDRYHRHLARGWWLWFSLLGLYGSNLLYQSRPRSEKIESIQDVPVSDAPIEASTQDCFNFHPIALGLARFFLNPKTEPPLTVGISGEWGMGKSSLMRLLYRELRRFGVRPVWFNAWHHQQDEQFLASLLKAVKQEAVPPIWEQGGIRFRFRLFGRRFVARPAQSIVLVTLLIIVGAFLIARRPQPPETWSGWAVRNFQQLVTITQPPKAAPTIAPSPRQAPNAEEKKTTPEPAAASPASQTTTAPASKEEPPPTWLAWFQRAFPKLTFLASLLGLLHTVYSRVRAFGVDPSKLLSKAFTSKPADLEARLGFLELFARDLREVTLALGNHRQMVVFIDDLDRCQPAKVAESLEAINYLVSNGACFVVMGVARKQVEAALALHFKEIASEVELRPEELRNARESGTDEQKQRSAYARLYLRKLVNLWVRVPAAQQEAILNMIVPNRTPAGPDPTRRFTAEFTERAISKGLKIIAFATLLLLLGAGTYSLAKRTAKPAAVIAGNQPGPSTNTIPQAAGEISQSASSALSETNFPRAVGGLVLNRTEPRRDLWNRGLQTNRWYLLIPLILGLAALYRAATWPRATEYMDRKDFREALKVWLPLLETIVQSPRDQKRFVNRVRYLALRERKLGDQPITGGGTDNIASENNHEAQLVRLDVLQVTGGLRPKLNSTDQEAFDKELQTAEAKHKELFPHEATIAECQKYEEISQEVEFV
jgi:photosystem II stability/assembly factor-like uncharacterized protein